MRLLKKHRCPLIQMNLVGTFLSAVFMSTAGTFAATPLREMELTTYLRDGPGVRYRAVDEAETGSLVSVVRCADGWCNVLDGGVSGYVAQSALAAPGVLSPMQNRVCRVDSQASYHGGCDVLFCRSGIASNGNAPARHP